MFHVIKWKFFSINFLVFFMSLSSNKNNISRTCLLERLLYRFPPVQNRCKRTTRNYTQFNLINNYYKAGPSLKAIYPLQFKSKEPKPVSRGFFLGNHFSGLPEKHNQDNYTALNYQSFSTKYKSTTREFFEAAKRFDAGKYKLTKIESAKKAYESCLKKSGCSLMRDAVDERRQ